MSVKTATASNVPVCTCKMSCKQYIRIAIWAFFGDNEFEHETDENLKWRKLNIETTDLGSLKLNSEWGKTLNEGMLSGSFTAVS